MTPKLTKSWILTIIAFACTIVFPIANDFLTPYGIIITESEMTYYLSVFLSAAGFGTISSIKKTLQAKKGLAKELLPEIKLPEHVKSVNSKTKTLTAPPTLGPEGSWYQTNLRKDEHNGNFLPFGQSYLWIKYKDVRSYITAILKTAEGVPVQIDQSSEFDEDNNVETTRLEMFDKSGAPLPKGKYILQTQGDRGTSDSQGIKEDEFSII